MYVGLNMGTTNARMAHTSRKGHVTDVCVSGGDSFRPCGVQYIEGEMLAGVSATCQNEFYQQNTLSGIKTLIGRDFLDDVVQTERRLYPFKIVAGEGNKILYEVDSEEEEQPPDRTSVDEVYTELFAQLRIKVSRDYDATLFAVLTVPVYFNQRQREATKQAGISGGLHVLEVIDEAVAAVYAYELNSSTKPLMVLVFHRGGSTFEVTALRVNKQQIEILASANDLYLGGTEFDFALFDYCIKFFKQQNNRDFSASHRACGQLMGCCERTKRQLQTSVTADIKVDKLCFSLERSTANSLWNPLVDEIRVGVENVLRQANMDTLDINEVVLVGGSSNLPAVQQMLKHVFSESNFQCGIKPEEVCAAGAARRAHLLRPARSRERELSS